MCYGSGCCKEDHMGDCICFLSKEEKRIIKESKYNNICLLFGDIRSITDNYLNREEHFKFTAAMLNDDLNIIDKLENIAWERWDKDEERLDLIKRLSEGKK